MINIDYTLLIAKLKNKETLTENDKQTFQNTISKFVYPIGAFPVFVFFNNTNYMNCSLQNNLDYLSAFTSEVYKGIYTEDELYVLNIYLLLNCYRQTIIDESIISILVPLFSQSFEKVDVEYCLDEIRYMCLTSLLYTNSPERELINSLIEHLKVIEQAHNNIRIDESIIN